MKRAICVILIIAFLVPVCSLADSATSLLWMFNFNAKTYGGKQLDESMITENTEKRVVFSADDATIAFASTSGKFKSALVVSADEAEFLPYCLCAAMSVSPSFNDNALVSFGDLLYCYLTVRSGDESEYGTFGDLRFNIKKDGDNYRFIIGEK